MRRKTIKIISIEDEPENKKENPSFQELVSGNYNYNIDTSSNQKAIIENIKNLLKKLKNNNKSDNIPKIRITDSIFFCDITSEKKKIDPFFMDPEIIKYCDLSAVNFEDADIRGAYLAYTNARIVLSKVYEKSIEGTNLEGIPLSGQSLDGINADNANLKSTGVFVSVDRASIINTKFSDSTVFMLGTRVLTDEEVKAMGILVSEEQEVASNLKL